MAWLATGLCSWLLRELVDSYYIMVNRHSTREERKEINLRLYFGSIFFNWNLKDLMFIGLVNTRIEKNSIKLYRYNMMNDEKYISKNTLIKFRYGENMKHVYTD